MTFKTIRTTRPYDHKNYEYAFCTLYLKNIQSERNIIIYSVLIGQFIKTSNLNGISIYIQRSDWTIYKNIQSERNIHYIQRSDWTIYKNIQSERNIHRCSVLIGQFINNSSTLTQNHQNQNTFYVYWIYFFDWLLLRSSTSRIKDYTIGNCCFSAKYAALRSKKKD